MLSIDEKKRVKDIIEEGLGIRRDINFAFFSNEINNTNKNVETIKSQITQIICNQRNLETKLDKIIRMLMEK